MSDIVKRLRGMYSRGPFGTRDFSPYIPAISLEAADEIERLRAGLDAAVDKTLKYELDCAGIESRYKDSVELVELRAERGALADRYRRAVRALQDIAALKPKPKTSGKEIAIHALAMIGEPREEIS